MAWQQLCVRIGYLSSAKCIVSVSGMLAALISKLYLRPADDSASPKLITALRFELRQASIMDRPNLLDRT